MAKELWELVVAETTELELAVEAEPLLTGIVDLRMEVTVDNPVVVIDEVDPL